MLNLLIIDDDIKHTDDLLNYISQNGTQLRLHYIVNKLSKGIDILNKGTIDLVLINTNDSINKILFKLHCIYNCFFEKYKKSMIILSDNSNNLRPDFFVYCYLSHTEDISTIFLKLNEIAIQKNYKASNSVLISKINTELEYIGYNLSYVGTKYLSEIISIIYNNNNITDNLNKNIYPIIAKKYNKTINNIKCNISIATECMFYECDEIRLKQYFNLYTTIKPKPKLIISTILNKILMYN